MSAQDVVLQAQGLEMTYKSRRRGTGVKAVSGVSFELRRGETLAIVGESGCGKSTTGRMVTKLLQPTAGTVRYGGEDVTNLSQRQMRPHRARVQMVFQDSMSSLDPRFSVREIVAEPLRVRGEYGRAGAKKVDDMLSRVGIDPAYGDRKAGALSGGQRQRLGIARALVVDPEVLVLDEPVSALDVSVQAQVLTLFKDLQRDLGVAYLFISHDLAVVRNIADRIAVMYLGKVVETGTADDLFEQPTHPYTHGLLSAVPVEHPRLRERTAVRLYRGEPADLSENISGCPYRTRCYKATDACATAAPPLVEFGASKSACFFPEIRTLADVRSEG
jgi:oligopeptide/dipeptide ABC transporter ATP-binding protein